MGAAANGATRPYFMRDRLLARITMNFRGRAQPLPHMPPSNGLFIKQIVSDSRHSHGKAQ